MKLYCAIDRDRLSSIATDGMPSGSYWTSLRDMASYYEDVLWDDEKEPAVLVVDLEYLDETCLNVDRPSLDEPITKVLGMDEDEIRDLWTEMPGTWQDCLQLVGSIFYKGIIRPEAISILQGFHQVPLPRVDSSGPTTP